MQSAPARGKTLPPAWMFYSHSCPALLQSPLRKPSQDPTENTILNPEHCCKSHISGLAGASASHSGAISLIKSRKAFNILSWSVNKFASIVWRICYRTKSVSMSFARNSRKTSLWTDTPQDLTLVVAPGVMTKSRPTAGLLFLCMSCWLGKPFGARSSTLSRLAMRCKAV